MRWSFILSSFGQIISQDTQDTPTPHSLEVGYFWLAGGEEGEYVNSLDTTEVLAGDVAKAEQHFYLIVE